MFDSHLKHIEYNKRGATIKVITSDSFIVAYEHINSYLAVLKMFKKHSLFKVQFMFDVCA